VDFRRTRAGEWAAALAGLVLLASLFLDWYRPAGGGAGVSGWEAFTIVDLLLALLALAALGLPLITASQRAPAVSIAADTLTTLVGIVVSALILIRTLNTPGLGADEDAERLAGAWIGLAATLAIVLAGFVAMRNEGLDRADGRWEPGEESGVAASSLPAPKA